jgi:diamine N-acetyltransferase
MVRLKAVNGKNVWELLNLSVEDSQREFVASNDTSIIEAYTTITAHGYAKYGFVENGDMDGEEIIAVLKL